MIKSPVMEVTLMEGLRCPKCGSDGLSQPRPDEYQCL